MINEPNEQKPPENSPAQDESLFKILMRDLKEGLRLLWSGEAHPGMIFFFVFVGGLIGLLVLCVVQVPEQIRWALFYGWMFYYIVCQWRSTFHVESISWRSIIRFFIIFLCLCVLVIVKGCEKMI